MKPKAKAPAVKKVDASNTAKAVESSSSDESSDDDVVSLYFKIH